MLFSIIIPAYNIEDYILQTLQSILENPMEACEIILVDDGSTDHTKEKAEAFLKERATCAYTVVSQENKGVSAARNEGILRAKGEYLIFCDGDDFFMPNLIQTVKENIADKPELVAWRYFITQNGEKSISQKNTAEGDFPYEVFFEKALLGETRVRLGSFAIKSKIIKENTIYFTEGCAFAEDVEFIMKCLSKVKSVRFLKEALFVYAKRTGSVMYSYRIDRFTALDAISRIYEFVREDETLLSRGVVGNYLKNGFFILHAIYSFDACISYLAKKDISLFYREYRRQFPGLKEKIKKRLKHMQIPPVGISKKKLTIFRMGRRLYTYVYTLRK
ncbi:MAG: glycosyltransferase family A protein [Lachnospiraceae bacterium]|nr:glycosyltransferase family A protein [Lachnospiraceae bacterium]